MKKIINNRKLPILIFIVISITISLFGYLYTLNLRKKLTSSSANYENTINDLQHETSITRDNIKNNAAFITNEAAGEYPFEVNLSDVVTINGIGIDQSEEKKNAVFLVAGHIYGNPASKGEPTPSNSIINAVGLINRINPDIFITLGDLVYSASDESFQTLHNNFLDQIDSPIINAPGNHDLAAGRLLYEKNFGQTYYSFVFRNNQIIVLDTIIANCYIEGHQKEMLEYSINKAIGDKNINNVLIFFHNLIFLDCNEDLSNRTNQKCKYGTNYEDLYQDILFPGAQKKPIFLIAGDVGAYGGFNLSPYYDKHPDADLFTLAVGLGDGEGDALLLLNCNSQGVTFEIISLNNKIFKKIETYSPEYWKLQPH